VFQLVRQYIEVSVCLSIVAAQQCMPSSLPSIPCTACTQAGNHSHLHAAALCSPFPRYFQEQGRELDFFLVANPTWLDAKFPAQAKQVKRPCMALVSSDKQWIT
jgi:hypothetical protein